MSFEEMSDVKGVKDYAKLDDHPKFGEKRARVSQNMVVASMPMLQIR